MLETTINQLRQLKLNGLGAAHLTGTAEHL